MTLFDLLTRIRDYYVDRFREQLKASPEKSEQRIQSEDVVVDLNGKPQTEGFLDLPLRIDLLIIEGKEASKTIIVDTEKLLAFQPVSIMWQHLPVRIAPFKWNSLRFTCTGADRSASWEPIKEWFHRWFTPRESVAAKEPAGVVHFLSDPTWDGDLVTFTADLGTAPVTAFENLLDALAKLPIKQVQFGTV